MKIIFSKSRPNDANSSRKQICKKKNFA
jgi:hypothetical protein